MNVGEWARRKRGGMKWHLIESVVADAAITRCGHRLEPRDGRGYRLETASVEPLTRMIDQPQNCEVCR